MVNKVMSAWSQPVVNIREKEKEGKQRGKEEQRTGKKEATWKGGGIKKKERVSTSSRIQGDPGHHKGS